MKGFNIAEGYMGWIGDRYMLFASEQDYKEFMKETWHEILDLVNIGKDCTGICNTNSVGCFYTATEIKFLERLYDKVSADMKGRQE